MMRTMYCGDLNISSIGLEVVLCGWVTRRRVFGKFIFIEMRDREGEIQIFFDPNKNYDVFRSASKLRNEFCLQIHGMVRPRPLNQINNNIKTGAIEVLASNIRIINVSEPLPLDLSKKNSEEQRLRYRYLDLRRSIMFERLRNRSRIMSFVHRFMETKGFLNIETPVLSNPTLEGARDYLVPSRLHKGKFYALPQSPQIFKQLLMMSGFDRYYQITKCFRDEDMRSDRQPEFTQIDLETSFMSSEEVREIMESLIRDLWNEILSVELKKFHILTYKQAISRFASDHPDLRNPVSITYLSNVMSEQIKSKLILDLEKKDITFKVMIMYVPSGAKLSNEQIIRYIGDFKSYGGENLSWIKCSGFGYERKFEGSGIHVFDSKTLKNILLKVAISNHDLLFLSYYNDTISNRALHELRSRLGRDLQLIDKGGWFPLWIVDFPMFKRNDKGNIISVHHIFSAPKDFNLVTLLDDPLSIIADSFDMVCNGCELGSGSVRIHSRKMQKEVFKILGFSEYEQKNRFGFLLDALKYGAPIHAGMACGLDRLVMLLSGTDNIRDVIAFPKTTNGFDLLTNTPSFFNEDEMCNLTSDK